MPCHAMPSYHHAMPQVTVRVENLRKEFTTADGSTFVAINNANMAFCEVAPLEHDCCTQ